jgi:hypothetical protein
LAQVATTVIQNLSDLLAVRMIHNHSREQAGSPLAIVSPFYQQNRPVHMGVRETYWPIVIR